MTRIDPDGLIDHFVYGVLDLPHAVDDLERRLGVRPAEGGRHLGRGTRNYLLALSPPSYLEIIALDDDNPTDPGAWVPFGLDSLQQDRVITWAVHPADLDGALVKMRRHGVDLGKATPMSRVDGDGNELHWTLAVSPELPFDGLAPFLIDWGDSPHPAGSGIPRAQLSGLQITSPAADQLNALYKEIRLDVTAAPGEAAMRITITGPAGSVTL